jgi:hypothetical protein
MASNKELYRWKGRPISKPEHTGDLESHAAVLEFKHRMTKEDAEHRAHTEYAKEQHQIAAAHHLAGLKAAQGAGNQDEARKHGLLYGEHLKRLGEDPMGAVPASIKSLSESQGKLYRFKPHSADTFLLDD